MTCPDWSCNKKLCKIRNNITTAFRYTVCIECKNKRSQKRCSTCIYGDKIRSISFNNLPRYLCMKDNTIVNY